MKKTLVQMATVMMALGMVLGCGMDAGDSLRAEAPTVESKQPKIEEPDIYRVEGNWLYVQNPQTGLNVLDVSTPSRPKLVGRAAVVGAAGAEMYLSRKDQAVVMLKTATNSCQAPQNLKLNGWSYGAEAAFVDTTQKKAPRIMGRFCLPGGLVASRTVDKMLYVVTTDAQRGSQAISIDIADPHAARVVQQMAFPNASKEIKVTATFIYVAGRIIEHQDNTQITLIGINSAGKMTRRGSFAVPGAPQGRFHMDIAGDQFRIVTYDTSRRESRLFVLDIKNPDKIKVLGELGNIGNGEKLYATRFDGDRAYVVTFRRTDPLWVISLADPTKPTIVGALHVPGWSDFLFPRGNTLIAVGRGNNGGQIGVSLFDVSNPKSPRSLSQVQVGNYNSTSEANVDHRGVTILELPGQNPLVVVPYTAVEWSDSCSFRDHLQLVEVQKSNLRVRGNVSQSGMIRRSLLLSDRLYSIGDYEVLAVDISNRDNPRVDGSVTLGTSADYPSSTKQYCNYYGPMGDDTELSSGFQPFFCSVGAADAPLTPPATVLFGLLALVWRLRRRK